MRHLPTLLAALTLISSLPTAAMAQTPSPTTGVSVAEVRSWLSGMGGAVGEPTTSNGVTTLHIADPIAWNLSFYSCGPTLCDDAQFNTAFTGQITPDQINAWNRDHRFLMAFLMPSATRGGDSRAVVQYDVLLTGNGTEQLRDPIVLWLQLLRDFSQYISSPSAAPRQ